MIKNIKKYLSINKYLCISALIFLFLRLLFLDQLFLLHDERDIVFSGYSIAKTAHDLFGNFLPLSFTGISPDNPLVSIYYSSLWWILLPFRSVFFARFPFVLISTLLIFLVYEIIKHILQNQKVALIASIIFAFSPWVFHITRLALDLPLAAVTLFAGILFYLKQKRWLSYVLFFLTFYNYQGFRIVIPFLLIYLELICHSELVSGSTPRSFTASWRFRMTINLLFILFLFLSVAFIDKSVTTNRFSQVVFLNANRFTQEVNLRRASSSAPKSIQTLFHNKISVAVDYVVDNFVKGQDVSYLFKTGDYSPINGNAVGGQFFFPSLLFYYFGIIALGNRMKKEDFYIVGFIFIGLLPAVVSVNSTTYSIRGFLSAIGYAYLLSLGLLFTIDFLKRISRKKRIILISLFSLIILFNSIYFIYNYYARRPHMVGELFKENERQLANYLMDNRNKSYTIFHAFPKDIYLSYLFLNNSIPFTYTNKQPEGQREKYEVHSFSFEHCPDKINFKQLTHTILSETCVDLKTHDKLNDPAFHLKKILYKDISLKTAYFIFE